MAQKALRRLMRNFRQNNLRIFKHCEVLNLEYLESRFMLNASNLLDECITGSVLDLWNIDTIGLDQEFLPDEEDPEPTFPIVAILEESPNEEGINDGYLIFNAFGPTLLGNTVEQIFQIDNIGTGDLENLTFVFYTWDNDLDQPAWNVADPDANPFSLSPAIETFLPLGLDDDPVDITVTYEPEQTGNYLYRLDICYNQLEEEFIESLILQASAVNPALTITDNQGIDDDESVDFGQYEIDGTHQYSVTLTNDGTTPLILDGWDLSGNDPEIFSVTDYASVDSVLDPEEALTITVSFNPATAGGYNAELLIDTNIPGAASFSVSLTGTVLISDSQDDPFDLEINFTPEDPIIAGQVSDPQTVSLYNNTDENMLLESITVNNRYFVIDSSQIPDMLEPGDTVEIPITFNPGNLMIVSEGVAQLTITTDNDSGDNEQEFVVPFIAQALAAPLVATSSLFQTARAENGAILTVRIIGSGEAQLVPLTSGMVGIDKIILSNTTAQTILLITSSSDATLGGIEGGSLGMLIAQNLTLNDEGLELNTLSRMICGVTLSEGADLTIAQTGTSGVIMQLGEISNGSNVSVNGDVSMFNSQSFGNGTFSASNVNTFISRASFNGNMSLTGNLRTVMLGGTAITGNFIIDGTLNMLFASSATLTGAINAGAIGTIRFGNIVGADISTAGRIQSLNSSRDLIDSRILAGYDLGADGRLGGVGDAADQLFSGGVISQVSIQRNIRNSFISAGIAPTGTNFFNASATAIGNVGTVRLGGHVDNGTPYGVSAATGISSVTLGLERVQINQSVGDFEVRLLD